MKPQKSIRQKLIRIGRRTVKWMCYSLLAFVALLVIGLIPVNSGFRAPAEGIELFLVSNPVHADIIVPRSTAVIDWDEIFEREHFEGDISKATHIAFGWGDRGFFLETETWDDLKASTAANALLIPSSSCIHVTFTNAEFYTDAVSVTVTPEQYEELVSFIDSSFKKDVDGAYVQIEDYAYSQNDAFYEAVGRYHVLNTCNSWIGRALKRTGVKVPWLSPLPRTPMLYLEDEDSSCEDPQDEAETGADVSPQNNE